ncbi:putative PAS/PAC sensor protein [Methanohalobium evestigatum Z-7303]|uniref:histidine kinase n=1 Tax=Methanohalobium evestigatum (strain ATCC BAA-1072 / DSM 3721 / NBRC 107634 / OCM 161 / Z-7303) TaxID=644295 RepID=D7E7T4_METEZ|nr:GAF domain-containing protein [Methanohalobium evestigatum]ADI74157.1 putative PAS/PAC sensor protein [Methanohalobium evestigatum Z-7303]
MDVYLFLWKSRYDWSVEYITSTQPFGYARDDLTSGNINYLDIVHPKDIDDVTKNFASCSKSGSDDISLQYRVITNSGDIRWVNEKVISHANTDSSQQYLSIVIDITDSKMEEEKLQETLAIKDELESIINNSPAIVFQWKSECKLEEKWPVEFVSDNINRFGYTPDEFVTGELQYGDIIYPDDLERVQYELCKRREKGHNDFSQEYRIVTKSGKIRWVDERTFIQRDKDGNPVSYQGIIVDITDRKHTENILHTEHDIALVINSLDEPEEILNQVLDLTINIGIIDCGCIHFIDEYGNLNLMVYKGLSHEFVNNISYLGSNSILNRIIMTGQPVYKDYSEIPFKSDLFANKNERLRAVALIPLVCNGEVLGSLNLSSHLYDEIPVDIRTAIETIAAQLGGFIARMKAEMNLYEYHALSSSIVPNKLELYENKQS